MAPSEWARVPTVDLDATTTAATATETTEDEPSLPWPLWLHTPTGRGLATAAIIIWVPTAIAWYFYLTASVGCRVPVCYGGALQCCPGRGSGTPCVGRPDLVGRSCTEWALADRPCERYFCAYAGNATGGAWLPASDETLEATFGIPTTIALIIFIDFASVASLSLVLVILAVYYSDDDRFTRECAHIRSEHERRLSEHPRRRLFLVSAPPVAV